MRLKGVAPETSTKPKHLKLLAAMFVKTEQDVKLVPEVRNCEAQFVLEFIECGTTHIAQRHMFELAPLIFDRVEFRRVARQAFQLQPCGRAAR